MHLYWFFLTLLLSDPVFAKTTNLNLASCSLKSKDFDVFLSFSTKKSFLRGRVLGKKVNCRLELEEVKDLKKSASLSLFKILSYRRDSNCKEFDLALKRGVNDHIDLELKKESAFVSLFERHKKIKCNLYKAKNLNLQRVAKQKPKPARIESYSRRVKKLELSIGGGS